MFSAHQLRDGRRFPERLVVDDDVDWRRVRDCAELLQLALRGHFSVSGGAHRDPHAVIGRQLFSQLDAVAAARTLGDGNVALHDQVETAQCVDVGVEPRGRRDLELRASRDMNLLAHSSSVDREIEQRTVGDERVARFEG